MSGASSPGASPAMAWSQSSGVAERIPSNSWRNAGSLNAALGCSVQAMGTASTRATSATSSGEFINLARQPEEPTAAADQQVVVHDVEARAWSEAAQDVSRVVTIDADGAHGAR